MILILNCQFDLSRVGPFGEQVDGPPATARLDAVEWWERGAWTPHQVDGDDLPYRHWRGELRGKRGGYYGDEVCSAETFTWEQLVRALPRPGLAASIEAVSMAEGEVGRCLLDPDRTLLTPEEQRRRDHVPLASGAVMRDGNVL